MVFRDSTVEKFWNLSCYMDCYMNGIIFNKSMTFCHHFTSPSLEYKQYQTTFLRLWRKKPYYSISDLWHATALLNCLCLWSVWLRFLLVKPSTSQMSNNNVAIFHLEISVSPIRRSISLIHIITHLPMYFLCHTKISIVLLSSY